MAKKKTKSYKKRASLKRLPIPIRPLKLWQDDTNNSDVRIEILPLIDVIFCILTFFLLAAVGFSRQQAISLNLPKASTGKPIVREMLLVTLDDLGRVYINQNPVTRNQLNQTITNYHQSNPNGLMVLYASRDSSYNDVIQVLDLLKQVGGDRVALATLPGESEIPINLNPQINTNGIPNQNQIPNLNTNPISPNLPTIPEINSDFNNNNNLNLNPVISPNQTIPNNSNNPTNPTNPNSQEN